MKLTISYEEYLQYLQLLKLSSVQGSQTQLISCYVGADKTLTEVSSKLRAEKQESANIKDKTNRKQVLSAIEHALTELQKYGSTSLTHGIAIFATPNTSFSVIPSFINKLNYYRCDSSFYIKPLLDQGLATSVSYGLLALDSDEATFAELKNGAVTYLHELDSNVSRSVKKGGQSQRRYAFARIQALLHYYNTVAQLCNEFWQSKQIKKIYYGGILPESERFIKRNTCLLDSVAKKFSECYPLQYTNRLGIKQLMQLAEKDMQDTAYIERVRFFEQLLTMIDSKKVTAQSSCAKHVCVTSTYLKKNLEDPLQLDSEIAISIVEQGTPAHAHVEHNYGGLIYLTTKQLAT